MCCIAIRTPTQRPTAIIMYAVVPVASAIHIRTCSYRLDALKERHQINIFKQAWVLSFVILGGSVLLFPLSH